MTQSATFGAVLGSGATGSQVRVGLNLSDEAAATDHEGTSEPAVTYKFMRWRNDTAKIVRRRNAANSAWEIIENYGATKTTLTFTPATTGDYLVIASAVRASDANGAAMRARLNYVTGSLAWGDKAWYCKDTSTTRRSR